MFLFWPNDSNKINTAIYKNIFACMFTITPPFIIYVENKLFDSFIYFLIVLIENYTSTRKKYTHTTKRLY